MIVIFSAVRMIRKSNLYLTLIFLITLSFVQAYEEVEVIGISPSGPGLSVTKNAPFSGVFIDETLIEDSKQNDSTKLLVSEVPGVSVNSVQNGVFQDDLMYRGYAASPLVGVPQGLSVLVNGIRMNEPLGDELFWEIIPLQSMKSISFMSGGSPLYGLNALGGAISYELKSGLDFEDTELSGLKGSWGRSEIGMETGFVNSTKEFGVILNYKFFDENSWREESPSDYHSMYINTQYKSDFFDFNLGYLHGNSELTGNGVVPIGLLVLERDAIFTAPDSKSAIANMLFLETDIVLSDDSRVEFDTFFRLSKSKSFNGDSSELSLCNFSGTQEVLIEGLKPNFFNLGLSLDQICGPSNIFGASSTDQLENALESSTGLNFDLDELDDDEIFGTGRLSDQAINNQSDKKQNSYGLSFNWFKEFDTESVKSKNLFGFQWFEGRSRFSSLTELANINPISRSTDGLGLGTFLIEESTIVATTTNSLSGYFSSLIEAYDKWTVSIGGRYNYSNVHIRDKSGIRSELDGSHKFSRFNPELGVSYAIDKTQFLYFRYSESSRIPTPIELSCNEETFRIARELAAARGDDPNDIDFECRLPNAFVADPPLDQVVSKNKEIGYRIQRGFNLFEVNFFYNDTHDDILFQSTGRGTGIFNNINKTRRIGGELKYIFRNEKIKFSTSYLFFDPTFEDNFSVVSPNHPQADSDGRILVFKGDTMTGVSRHQVKANFDFFEHSKFPVSIKSQYFSGQFLRGDESNSLKKTDDYINVDLIIRTKLQKNFEAFLQINNLFDSKYESFGLLGEDPRSVISTLSGSEFRYFSPGAPRGTWLGFAFKF